ncbi:phosphoribosylanthranilate isomerase [Luteibacter rhizovicinus]|uniref:N-(5'-phosphoribosyl)anthranilate isomerase n=1 Tax=Luteibacter rhizovicinus TaxID=242606 RepID=A0A4R3YQU9_9GAMM|nr:phosphoribosylanthranilate isomerase [Luteibacter rhizovicinus]TCV94746.1 phosphoribosylanthranilate isomerase [Luteibacter rhizovicinus]
MRTRIKCCGITREEDADLAADLGADAIGFVFTRRSKRFIEPEAAARIRATVPPFVSVVALVMDDEPDWIAHVVDTVRPDMLQFHGNERDDDCAAFGLRYLKAIAMGEGASALARLRDYPRAAGLLLDGHGLGEMGGSGHRFDWSLMPADLDQPLLLAGGLTADNVAQAIEVARPWAVDVSSGIETSPGIKDGAKMERFISAVRRASP